MFKKEIKTSLSKYISVLILISSLVVLSAGCQKNAEKPEGETTKKDTTNMVQPGTDTTAAADTTKKYPDLTGTWTGKFENHSATLKITEQHNENFKANLSVSYREPMNKTISGTITRESNKMTMKDDTKSRYDASYNATLSEDMKKISGTAHFKVDGNNESFTFTKK